MPIILHTLQDCPNCQTLKERLLACGYEFEERDMSTAEDIAELRFMGNFSISAPVLQVDDTFFEFHECNHESFFSSLMRVCGEKVDVAEIAETHGKLST